MNGNWTLGLDLGLIVDYSALALVTWQDEHQRGQRPLKHLLINNLKRWPVPCDYPTIARDLGKLVVLAGLEQREGRLGVPLVLDASGAGGERIVAFFDDAWRRGQLGTRRPWPAWVTGGQVPSKDRHISRGELLMELKISAQENRLHIAPELGLGEAFLDELRHLQLRKSPTGEDIYESVGKHDDIAMAVALAAYGAKWHPGDERHPYVPAPG
jgi:hypothetical protein